VELDEFDSNDTTDEETYDVEVPFTQEYQVYFLALGIGEIILNPIGPSFKLSDDAELFAKKQYYLRTGDYPFVVTGISNSYHSKGKREIIPISDDEEESLIDFKKDDMFREFLLISNGNYVESHSLNPFAQW
jgi:hypothetical protein